MNNKKLAFIYGIIYYGMTYIFVLLVYITVIYNIRDFNPF